MGFRAGARIAKKVYERVCERKVRKYPSTMPAEKNYNKKQWG